MDGRATTESSARRTRRELLAAVGGGTAVAVAGCLGGGPDTLEDGDATGTATGSPASDILSTPVRGDPEAPVTVLAFEDFACPHCRDYSLNVVPDILAEYADDGTIRYEFHDFPIPVDEDVSWNAACAARAVQARADDEAFFEYAHALFEAQSDLGPDAYERLADDAGLDGAAVRESALDGEYRPTVAADRQRGEEAGVRGTPTVAVDGTVVDPTYDAISAAIEDALGTRTETP
ncbi:DsbA family protein [Halorientalis litorea]|jgi:protein-disulfide isomerase|uniref:DsbA family protein n=1 Tax=Halorientalis litorea TaxID=2931977 RepID=UPI001FF3BC24|nr:thioredoxin domain-containing protein [Halorientalis litorea]